ncbi:MAG: CCA tRNA nucleotidyltransferase [Gemmatimonadota bacterium]|nr:CCA tRNA nucleotidyltransferase [Gemmatimonadota bacterium]MDE3173182.1 CCA tRNA nucleotidyltransferase [Gemmatimonadota bacterium]MDE3216419.1 CCA tRNA nucleotidyltransferase [Gemmatimonadota bacterium]
MADRAAPRSLRPPRPVLDIAETLEAAGFETWCVGGAVRDALLGHPHLDWDLATSATPAQVRGLFGARRTIPVGIEFGTVGVLDPDRTMHEVTTFRRDVRTDGRHAEVEFGVSLDDDLARRDFTINAIAYSPRRELLHDPFGGRADLERRVVRAVGEPAARMREDRLRALRAIRFASRFGFEIDPPTWTAIVDSAPHLARLSPERVKQELEKTMEQVARPSVAIGRWREAGALHELVPALDEAGAEALRSLDCLAQPGPANRPNRRIHRMAGLFGDLPAARLGAALTALRCSRMEITWIQALVERWQRLGPPIAGALAASAPIDDAQVRRWVAGIGRLHLPGFFRLASARWAARREQGRAPGARDVRALYRRALRCAFRDPVDLRDLAIDGDDLRRAGIPAGPEMGRVLQALLDWVLDDPARNTPAVLGERAAALHADARGSRG